MTKATLKLRDLTCDRCIQHVIENLSELEGIFQMKVTHDEDKSGTAVVTGADIPADKALIETVKSAGGYTMEAVERQ